ncbi:MAG: Gfo/Idh/MocA family oxidoreductase [Gemmatimonadetes bacterium]|jgi:predicted dehydrogenase|nr:Gfo/Idh/MocA family oxidoreductase [Gemmatimonadota bacterium]
MKKQEIGIALLGCGFATRLHGRTLKKFSQVNRFFASRSAARAAGYAVEYRGSGSFGSYREAMEDERVDVVLVATPPSSHLDLTLEALSRGKHVIVEKPPFLRATDFDTVERAALEAGRSVFVAENYFYKPLTQALREVISSQVLGEPRILTINALKEQRTGDWRDDQSLAGGGALFEGGIHWVNFMGSLGMEITAVHGFRPGPHDGPEKTIVIVFEYATGAVGTLYYSWELGSPLKGLRMSALYGTEGTASFESNGLLLGVRGRKKAFRLPGARDLLGYGAMFEDFFDSIATGSTPRFTLAAARKDLERVESVYRSLQRDQPFKGGERP